MSVKKNDKYQVCFGSAVYRLRTHYIPLLGGVFLQHLPWYHQALGAPFQCRRQIQYIIHLSNITLQFSKNTNQDRNVMRQHFGECQNCPHRDCPLGNTKVRNFVLIGQQDCPA